MGYSVDMIQSGFNPLRHGFRFPNQFKLDLFSRVQLPFVNEKKFNELIYGLCGGMCYSALDYFHNHQKIPGISNVSEINHLLFSYLWQRQLDSLQGKTLFKMAQWMTLEDERIASLVLEEEVPKILALIRRKEPVVLVIIRVSGFFRSMQNHQVVAVEYKHDLLSQSLSLGLYDPNHPGVTPTISIGLNKLDRIKHFQQSTGERIRGFFVIPYQKQIPSYTLEEKRLNKN